MTFQFHIWYQLFLQLGGVSKREVLRIFFNKKIKRVNYLHTGYNFHINRKRSGFVVKNNPCLVVAKWILLPVYEMIFWTDVK
jgi:hypothetical protein